MIINFDKARRFMRTELGTSDRQSSHGQKAALRRPLSCDSLAAQGKEAGLFVPERDITSGGAPHRVLVEVNRECGCARHR